MNSLYQNMFGGKFAYGTISLVSNFTIGLLIKLDFKLENLTKFTTKQFLCQRFLLYCSFCLTCIIPSVRSVQCLK